MTIHVQYKAPVHKGVEGRFSTTQEKYISTSCQGGVGPEARIVWSDDWEEVTCKICLRNKPGTFKPSDASKLLGALLQWVHDSYMCGAKIGWDVDVKAVKDAQDYIKQFG